MDLKTNYMGLELSNPLVPSAGPLSQKLDGIRRMEDAGASAIVMFSLFEEQLQQDAEALEAYTTAGTDSFAEGLSFFPSSGAFQVGPDQYLKLIQNATEATNIPIIGSLNGVSDEGWTKYAKLIEQAGARALELNIYYIPSDFNQTGAEVEQQYIDVLRAVKSTVSIPVSVKLSPFFSSMGNIARRLVSEGADGLVLFNRFYQPDFDLEELTVLPNLELSTPYEIRLPLLWIGMLYGEVKTSLAATRGVHSAREVIKYIMAGADVVGCTSCLLTHGIGYLNQLLVDLRDWMEKNEYDSIDLMRGSMSRRAVADTTAFERANYIKIIEKYKANYVLKP